MGRREQIELYNVKTVRVILKLINRSNKIPVLLWLPYKQKQETEEGLMLTHGIFLKLYISKVGHFDPYNFSTLLVMFGSSKVGYNAKTILRSLHFGIFH